MSNSQSQEWLKKYRPDLSSYEEFYKWMHQNPELAYQEEETSQKIISKLKELSPDLDIHTNIGGYGLYAALRNGHGPVVLLRADFDGLPVKEATGLSYESKKTMKDRSGVIKPTMHACGHDFHTTALLAAAETLLNARESWRGTVVFLFEAAEETGHGARIMVEDGLYDPKKHACPIPDICLGQHVVPSRAGVVQIKPETAMMAADSMEITIYGRGGHGSLPHMCIDPVLTASSIVMSLQRIISREIDPADSGVVTVGSLQAGDLENIIPEFATLKINTRSGSALVREKIMKSVERIVRAECTLAGCIKEPTFKPTSSFPLTVNDAEKAKVLAGTFQDYFGDRYQESKGVIGSEDFSNLATMIDRPYLFWFFGGIDEKVFDEAVKANSTHGLPGNHSAYFAPALQPSLTTGIDAMVLAARTFLGAN